VFGKPPIRLEGEDTLNGNTQSRLSRGRPTASTSTLDSDAAPLDPSAIDHLSIAQLNERLAVEEEGRRLKEERRRKRRERKERKELERVALAHALNREQEEFEGFPSSVSGTYASVPALDRSAYRKGEFVLVDQLDIEGDDADFEAGMYTARNGRNSSRIESDSRSRTSGSISNPDQTHNHHYLSQQPGPVPPLVDPRVRLIGGASRSKRRPKASSKTSSSKTSQSSSLLSPVASSFPTQPPEIVPQDQAEFEGFPNDGSFPSVGFGGGKTRSSNSDVGVALARRGDD